VQTAAAFVRRAFSVTDHSVGEAMRRISGAAAGAVRDLSRAGTIRSGNIDLTQRWPVYGGRITEADLDVDQGRIAVAFERGRSGYAARPLIGRVWTFFRSTPTANASYSGAPVASSVFT
jgi:hypothetical protein